MPRVVLFGRRTAAVEDDYFFPVSCHGCLRLGWFVCFLFAFLTAESEASDNTECTPFTVQSLGALVVTSLIGVLIDAAIACQTCRGSISEPEQRQYVGCLAHFHVLQFVVEIATAVVGALLAYHEIQRDCEEISGDTTLVIAIRVAIGVKLVVTSLYGVFFVLTMCVAGKAEDMSLEDDEGYNKMAVSVRGWCKALSCCCQFEDDGIFSRVGQVMASVFHDTDRAGLGTTDLGASILLVRYSQLKQRRDDPHGFALGFMSEQEAAASPAIWSEHYGEPEWGPTGEHEGGSSGAASASTGNGTDATRPVQRVTTGGGLYREERSGHAAVQEFTSGPHPKVVRLTKAWLNCCRAPPAQVPFGQAPAETEQLVRVDSRQDLHVNRFCRPLDPLTGWENEILIQQAYYMPYALAIYGRLLYGFSNGPQALCHPLGTTGCAEVTSCHGVLGNGDPLDPASRRAISAMLSSRRRRRHSGEYAPPGDGGAAGDIGEGGSGDRYRKSGAMPTSDVHFPETGEEADQLARDDGKPLEKHTDCCLCDTVAHSLTTNSTPGTVLHASYGGNVNMRPFCVQVDERTQTIVVAVRGTLSAEDVLADADAEPLDVSAEPEVVRLTQPSKVWRYNMPTSGAGRPAAAVEGRTETLPPLLSEDDLADGVYVHRSMWEAAKNIYSIIEDECLLAAARSEVLDVETGAAGASASSSPEHSRPSPEKPLDVLVVGHSLGAGVTQMLTVILRAKYPQTRGYAYSPPGGSVSTNLAAALAQRVLPVSTLRRFGTASSRQSHGSTAGSSGGLKFPTITSLVLGDDVVPRLSMLGVMRLRCDMLQSMIDARIGKPRLLLQQSFSTVVALAGMICCCSTRSCQPGEACDCSPRWHFHGQADGASENQPLQSNHLKGLKALLRKTKQLVRTASTNSYRASGGRPLGSRLVEVVHESEPSEKSKTSSPDEQQGSVAPTESLARLQRRLLHPMVPGGRIMLLRKLATSSASCCDATRGTRDYAPYWITPAYLGRIHVSALMLRDHLPDVVDKVLVMVARGLTGDDVRESGWWRP